MESRNNIVGTYGKRPLLMVICGTQHTNVG
ncbi:hypothetical protein J2Y60_003947 [Arcicella sp. BE140]|nr:hypothetical protein [Arcicella sp. BE51]MDR6813735.1 hypothetical protein [Arcicella sp. BE140]MDR6825047.1 hypothetical protein [Arcicella sp. BE139]